jgi:DNA-binding SARP family transcriptional activator
VSDGVASSLHIQLLGSFAVRRAGATIIDDSWNRKKAASLVKLLALQPGHALHRDQVLDALWPDLGPGAAANNLHKSLFYLREACDAAAGGAPLVTSGGGVVSLGKGAAVDVDAFRAAANRARELRADTRAYEDALALYTGTLLPADRYEAWSTPARQELHDAHRDLALAAARLYELTGAWPAAVAALSRIAGDETDEEAQRALMRAHALAGDRDAALRGYDRTRAALRQELDAEPDAETQSLHEQIVAGSLRSQPTQHAPDGPMVGRECEIAELLGALESACKGSGGLALIGGEPGIGKTRLAEELVAHAGLRGMRVLWGRCDQSDAVPAYWPWIQALRDFDGARESEPERGGEFARLVATEATRGSLTDPRPEQGRFRLFDALTTFLRRAGRERPILLVLDDLHEADLTSLQLLRHVARESAHMPLLIVCTYRDVELTPEHPLATMLGDLVREPLRVRVALAGLDREEVARFVQATSGVAPTAAVVELLHHETEGNPFFLKECTLMLDSERTRHSLRTGRLTVPDNVRDAVARRLAKLSPECRETLEAAAIIGHAFDASLLRRITRASGARLLDLLNDALSARIIRRDESTPDAYSFWHGLIRQSLYDGMTARRRTSLHRRIAECIELLANAGRYAPELAYHYGEAALAGGDTEKAIRYALAAGDDALAVYAWDQALRHWDAARRLLERQSTDREALADLLERMPVVIANIGEDLERGNEYLERAIAIREELGQRERAAEDHSRLGIALSTHLGDTLHASSTNLTRALEHYRAAEPIIGGGEDRPAVAMFYAGIATVAFSGVHVRDGIAASEKAVEIADRLGMKSVRAMASLLRGGVLKMAGRLAESAALLEQAYELADESNDHNVAFYTSTNLADWTEGYLAGRGELLERELSRPRNATPSVQRTTLINDIGCALARNGRLAEARERLAAAPADFLRTLLLFYDGSWDEAEARLLEGVDMLRQVGNRSSLANRLNHLATLYLARDDLRRAGAMLCEELGIGIDGESPLIELRARAEMALIAGLSGAPDDAREHLRRSREIVANGESWGRKAGRVALADAVCSMAAGQPAQATRCFHVALSTFRERQLRWDEAETLVRWARALDAAGEPRAASDRRDEAIGIYGGMGAGQAWIAAAESRSDAAQ